MTYHLAFSKQKFTSFEQPEATTGPARPRIAMLSLMTRIQARAHQPRPDEPANGSDRLRSRIFANSPQHWTMARRLAAELDDDDVVYCDGEAIGLPFAMACADRPRAPRLAVALYNSTGMRMAVAHRLARSARKVGLWITDSRCQSVFLTQHLGVPEDRVRLVMPPIDTRYFTPAPPARVKVRPLVVSVGLEYRDYRTLAAATSPLDVDVRVAGYSANTRARRRAFPDPMPANMSNRFYAAAELVQLYRDADVVAVSVFDNDMAAGITSLSEALACGRPAVVTRTRGLETYLGTRDDVCRTVPPGDPGAMREAILEVLNDPEGARRMAERGRRWILEEFDNERWAGDIAAALSAI